MVRHSGEALHTQEFQPDLPVLAKGLKGTVYIRCIHSFSQALRSLVPASRLQLDGLVPIVRDKRGPLEGGNVNEQVGPNLLH